MKRFLFILIVTLSFSLKSQIILGYYYGNSSEYSHKLIEYNCLTHIAHAFLIPKGDGTITYNEWFIYPDLIQTAHENNKKIIVSIGGWGNSEGFKPMSSDPGKRMVFIKNLVAFIKLHGYDGADIDWEYPKKEDKENFNSLISEMRTAFDTSGIEILSAALPAIDWHNVFDVEFLKDKFSWFGIMTYDFFGPWEQVSGHNTALYSTSGQTLSIDSSVKHWKKKGVPEEKLCMGMEFSGYIFNTAGLHRPHKGAASIRYLNAINKLKDGWQYNWDDRAKVPYLTKADSLITIDDTASIRYKSRYVVENKLGGTIIWKIGLDYSGDYNEFLNIIGDNFLFQKPGKTDLIQPLNDELISETEITFKWSRPVGAGEFSVEISGNQEFSDSVIRIVTASNSIKVNNLKPFTIYYWRVSNESYTGEKEYSDIWSFFNYKRVKDDKIFIQDTKIIISGIESPETSVLMFNTYGEKIPFSKQCITVEGNIILLIGREQFLSGNYMILLNNGTELKTFRLLL